MFDTVLIANRGEIACRVIRTLRKMDIRSVAVYSEADALAQHVRMADEGILLGDAAPARSYLDIDKIIEAARQARVGAIHPGYGFLSENAEFARRVEDAGIAWIGPTPESIDAMGQKVAARNLMEDAGVPVAPGTREPVAPSADLQAEADRIGYPLIVKASAGGGGIGMTVVSDPGGLVSAVETARSRAERFFSSADVFLERYLSQARHVEVQILGLGDGRAVAIGERDCSVQRRHQKVVEESPSPAVDAPLRERMLQAATRAAEAVSYRGAGTVEMLLDPASGEFYFLEMNTRLQVEHPVTELVTGLDLVQEQLRIAAGEGLTFELDAPPEPSGHAVEFRVYAEDPRRFLPGPGTITTWREPEGEGIRVDSGYAEGDTVTPYYDPLMAKLCAHGATREQALQRLGAAAQEFQIEGPKQNLPFLLELLQDERFISGSYDTGLVDLMRTGAARQP